MSNILKKLSFYYILFGIVVLFTSEIIPYVFPFKNMSSLILVGLSVCLIIYYKMKVVGDSKKLVENIAVMILLLFLLRGIKYSAFTEVDVLARNTWYFYYVPLLLIPLFFFLTSISIYEKSTILKNFLWVIFITILLILMVITNDIHQFVFRFNPNFNNWDSDYSLNVGFFILTAWEYLLYFLAVAILIKKCRLTNAKKQVWLILVPFFIGIFMIILLVIDKMPKIYGVNIIEFPEAIGFMIACILECCMQLGLIPTNASYRKLMKISSIASQITDKNGKVVFKSDAAKPLTEEQFLANTKQQIDKNTILRRMEIPGGYGFWQEDISELAKLNESLEDVKERLSEERDLIRLQNELKEKQLKTEQRTLLYDKIANRISSESIKISKLAEEGVLSENQEKKDKNRRYITLLGAYIKRYANMMLLASSNSKINISELGLAIAESLHYLNYNEIPGELLNTANSEIIANEAIKIYELFENLIEENFSQLLGVYVNISQDVQNTFVKFTLEGVKTIIPEYFKIKFKKYGIKTKVEKEDDTTYICLTLAKGGKAV